MLTWCLLRNEQSIRQKSLNTCSFQAGNNANRLTVHSVRVHQLTTNLLRLASTARKMKETPCTFSQIIRFPAASHSVYGNVRTGNFHTVHNNKARLLLFASQNYT